MSKPTADWDRGGDRFYRKIQLYTAVFDQDLELENYVIAGAPYSGALGRYGKLQLSDALSLTANSILSG